VLLPALGYARTLWTQAQRALDVNRDGHGDTRLFTPTLLGDTLNYFTQTG